MTYRQKAILILAFTVSCLIGACGQPTLLVGHDEVPEPMAAPTPEIRSVSGVPKELVRQLIEDINGNESNFRLSEEELANIYGNLKLERYDLNNDATLEYFLYILHSDWCGAGSNCDYWVFREMGNSFELMLNDKVLVPQRTFTNGYLDLWSETPMGFCEANVRRISVTRYKFDGAKYQKQSDEYECRPLSRRGVRN